MKDRLLIKLAGSALAGRISREVGLTGLQLDELAVGLVSLDVSTHDAAIQWLRDRTAAASNGGGEQDAPGDPFEIAAGAGYRLYGPLHFKEFGQFSHFYRDGEALCKFRDENRSRHYHVFWLIKNGADSIQPEAHPRRDGVYGTSVMSVEVSKSGGGFTRICNRYNHSVAGCDNTLGSDLDKVAPGLAAAFRSRGWNTTASVHREVPGCVEVDGCLFAYESEINGVYYNWSENAIAQNGSIKRLGNRQALVNTFVIDLDHPEKSRDLRTSIMLPFSADLKIVIHQSDEDAIRANAKFPERLHIRKGDK